MCGTVLFIALPLPSIRVMSLKSEHYTVAAYFPAYFPAFSNLWKKKSNSIY